MHVKSPNKNRYRGHTKFAFEEPNKEPFDVACCPNGSRPLGWLTTSLADSALSANYDYILSHGPAEAQSAFAVMFEMRGGF